MKMKTETLTLKFLTPAFLGDAGQNGAWRTPPIKALLRQWWRVAYAAKSDFSVNIQTMRSEEARLFGHADNDGASRSLVRLRLGMWDAGKLPKDKWVTGEKIPHPEKGMVESFLYLGYGPLFGSSLKKNAAIQSGESSKLSLAFPDEHAPLLDHALWLMNRFGALGGRSRNGWGSFSLTPENGETLAGTMPLREWEDCLKWDWPHAIGKDQNGALVWQTAPQTDWKAVMTELAKLKIALRTHFPFTTGKNAPKVEARHLLSYPVTNHSVDSWGGNLRLPNSLRFKVRPTNNGKLVGVIFHVPCLPPVAFRPNEGQLKEVWQAVHRFIDQQQTLTRVQE
ncbi:MAG: hypothetical protein LBT71_11755 [Azoarcus sp.]|jgi:CRISPR-associated protein Cmr1|nr:hypothetical protein [Azoarcus sp.]